MSRRDIQDLRGKLRGNIYEKIEVKNLVRYNNLCREEERDGKTPAVWTSMRILREKQAVGPKDVCDCALRFSSIDLNWLHARRSNPVTQTPNPHLELTIVYIPSFDFNHLLSSIMGASWTNSS